jgi:hypothetical protein
VDVARHEPFPRRDQLRGRLLKLYSARAATSALEPRVEHAIVAQVEDVSGLELKLTPTFNEVSERHGHCVVTTVSALRHEDSVEEIAPEP